MSDLEEMKDESEHLCKTCPKGFETLDKLKKHERTLDETECLCPQCGILIVGKVKLLNHINNTHKSESCPNCNKTMNKKSLTRHKKSCIGTEQTNMFSCESCEYKSNRKDLLEKHIERYHKKVILECDKCDYKTERLDYLNNHKYYMHINAKKIRESAKIFACVDCTYNTKLTSNFTRHLKSCNERKRRMSQDNEVMTNEELAEIFSETDSTQVDFNKILRWKILKN